MARTKLRWSSAVHLILGSLDRLYCLTAPFLLPPPISSTAGTMEARARRGAAGPRGKNQTFAFPPCSSSRPLRQAWAEHSYLRRHRQVAGGRPSQLKKVREARWLSSRGKPVSLSRASSQKTRGEAGRGDGLYELVDARHFGGLPCSVWFAAFTPHSSLEWAMAAWLAVCYDTY